MNKIIHKTMTQVISTDFSDKKHQGRTAGMVANWRAYYDITKPKVVALLVLTALVGMSLSVPGGLPWQILLPAMLGIALLSSAAAAINHIVDEEIDSVMGRTHHRPLPEGKISIKNAIILPLV